LAGIVLSMTTQTNLTTSEQNELSILNRELGTLGLPTPAYVFEKNIPDRAAIAQAAAHGLAYLTNSATKEIFDELGDELALRLGLP